MTGTKHGVTLVAALLALLVVAVPATAGASHETHPSLASSSPGGYPAKGFHHERTSLTGTCHIDRWNYMQVRSGNPGDIRAVTKIAATGCPSKLIAELRSVELQDLWRDGSLRKRYYLSGPVSPNYRTSARTVYRVGAWHQMGLADDIYRHFATIDATVLGIGSTKGNRLCSYGWQAGRDYRAPLC